MPTDTQQPHATEHPSDRPHSSAARLGAWAWLPVPVLLLAIIVTRVTDVRVAPTPSQVLFSIDVLTRMLPALVVIVMTTLTFVRRGTPGVLLLGCGVAMWAATGYVNTFTLALGPNFGITVTNVGLGLAALCHLAGVLPSGARKVAARGLGLVTGYGLVLVAVGLLCWATWQGWLPRFFVEGQGGMPIRFFVLSAAMVMFVLSALLLSAKQQTTSSRFAFWYTLALWLIALSVFGMLIQVSRDSLQNWMNRISQYLGSIYMLIAAITALRESGGAWLLPLEDALRESEERFRAGVRRHVDRYPIRHPPESERRFLRVPRLYRDRAPREQLLRADPPRRYRRQSGRDCSADQRRTDHLPHGEAVSP